MDDYRTFLSENPDLKILEYAPDQSELEFLPLLDEWKLQYADRSVRSKKYRETKASSFCRVDWGLPMLQVDVCFLGCHLVSRWCHTISAIHQLYPSPSQVGSRTGAPTVGFGGSSTPFGMGLSPTPMITVPVPATSNPACRFPALGFPVDFTSRVMRPIG